jgi:hypothetical protein
MLELRKDHPLDLGANDLLRLVRPGAAMSPIEITVTTTTYRFANPLRPHATEQPSAAKARKPVAVR